MNNNQQLLRNAADAMHLARRDYNTRQGESEASTARLWARVKETEAEYSKLLQQLACSID